MRGPMILTGNRITARSILTQGGGENEQESLGQLKAVA